MAIAEQIALATWGYFDRVIVFCRLIKKKCVGVVSINNV